MRFLFITDPWETLDHARDTSLRLMEECLSLGVEAWWSEHRSLRAEKGKIFLEARRLKKVASSRQAETFHWGEFQSMQPQRFQRILYRTDPPVDLEYLHPLQLLAAGLNGAKNAELVNPASVLFSRGEKLEAVLSEKLAPQSLISADPTRLKAFGIQQGRAVLKPLHEAQSKGVQLLHFADEPEKANEALRSATEGFRRPVVLQEYLPGIVKKGETRLWFLDGKLLAHVKKKPKSGDYRIDMDQGATLAESILTQREKKAIPVLGRKLKSWGVRLAAVDLIDGKVTDLNFTSPGLLVPMEALLKKNLAAVVVKSLIQPAGKSR